MSAIMVACVLCYHIQVQALKAAAAGMVAEQNRLAAALTASQQQHCNAARRCTVNDACANVQFELCFESTIVLLMLLSAMQCS